MFFAGRRANIMIMVNIMINIMVYHWESLVWAERLYKLNKWTKIGMKPLVFVNRKLASLLTRLLPHEMKPLLSCLNPGSCLNNLGIFVSLEFQGKMPLYISWQWSDSSMLKFPHETKLLFLLGYLSKCPLHEPGDKRNAVCSCII